MDILKITDEKVKKATRNTWKQWFSVLDHYHAQDHGHLETAKYLRTELGLGAWWAQAVTTRYEKEKGYWVKSGK